MWSFVAAGDERPQKVAWHDAVQSIRSGRAVQGLGKHKGRPYNRKAGVAQAGVAQAGVAQAGVPGS